MSGNKQMSASKEGSKEGSRPRWATAFEKSPLRGSNRAELGPCPSNSDRSSCSNKNSDSSSSSFSDRFSSPSSIGAGCSGSSKKRVVSLDSSSYVRPSGSKNNIGSKGANEKRSLSSASSSSGHQLMQRLKFESTAVENTPLSSLRSCSEFQKFSFPKAGIPINYNGDDGAKKTSFFSKLFSWGKNDNNNNSRNKKNKESDEDDRTYIINQLRSRDNNDSFYESIYDPLFLSANSSPSKTNNNTPTTISNRNNSKDNNNNNNNNSERAFSNSFFKALPRNDNQPHSFSSSFRSPSRDTLDARLDSFSHSIPDSPTRKYRKSQRSSILYETAVALDVLFGFSGSVGFDGCMEIELQDMKPMHRRQESRESGDLSVSSLGLGPSPQYLQSLHTSTSFTNLTLLATGTNLNLNLNSPATQSTTSTTTTILAANNSSSNGENSSNSSITRNDSAKINDLGNHLEEKNNIFIEKSKSFWASYVSSLVYIGNKYIISSNSDFLYENIRVQPFSSGAYLRGLLVSGYSNLFMTLYIIYVSPPSSSSPVFQYQNQNSEVLWRALHYYLIFQLVANLTQMPFRVNVHRFCWESSKAVDVQGAILMLRDMLQSDYWAANLILGRIIDVLSILFLLFGEVYLFYHPISGGNDPIRSLVVSISTTCFLTFLIRAFVSTLFCISMHDPTVLSDARKRGLSSCDIDALPTFLFSSPDQEQVKNQSQCTICIGDYTEGETLLSLPCDGKHCFHADCIREWLNRHNSCPLCQKMI